MKREEGGGGRGGGWGAGRGGSLSTYAHKESLGPGWVGQYDATVITVLCVGRGRVLSLKHSLREAVVVYPLLSLIQ